MKAKEYLDYILNMNLGAGQKNYFTCLSLYGKEYVKRCDSETINTYSIINSPVKKECFKNSLLLALWCPEIEYVEGYYVFDDIQIPFEHAWNLKGEEIIDTTANLLSGEVIEYFGMVVPKDVLKEFVKTDQQVTALQYYLIKNGKIILKDKTDETV